MRVLIDLQACQSPGGSVRGVGRYSMALCRALLNDRRGHEVWVAVNAAMPASAAGIRDALADLLPADRVVSWSGLRPTQAIDPANHARAAISQRLREDFFEKLGVDVVLTMSMVDGYGDDVVTSVRKGSSALQAAIVFDLIPLHLPDVYLSRPGARAWYGEKLKHLAACDVLLGISNYATTDAVASLGVAPSRVSTISAAVGGEFRPTAGARAAGCAKLGIARPFVMYAGGFDERKNLVRLIEAYASLPPSLRSTHQLVLVGSIGAAEKQTLQKVSISLGLPNDAVVFTGFVSDRELIGLYNATSLYVFPSTHEGFGLPALEAMSCGAIVVGSNTTSLPEVIDFEPALFDPYSVEAIASAMVKGLTDERFRAEMRTHGLKQAKRFSWERSAQLAWSALEAAHDSPPRALGDRRQPQDVAHALRVAVIASGPVDAKAMTVEVGMGGTSVELFAQNGASGGPSMASFVPDEFDHVIVQVKDDVETARSLLAVRGHPATLWLETEEVTVLTDALEALDPALLRRALYGWGGYSALVGANEAAASKTLPADVLEFLDPCWRVRRKGDTSVGRPVGEMLASYADMPQVRTLDPQHFGQLAAALEINERTPGRLRSLFVDISNLVVTDAKTGIQRVVRHVLMELLTRPPEGFRVEPVYLVRGEGFRYARAFTVGLVHTEATPGDDAPVAFAPGDVFLGLDLAAHLVPHHRDVFVDMRAAGVPVYFVVYDILPLLRPDCFDEAGLPTFRAWYEAIADLADGIVTISRTVADEFKQWLDQALPARGTALKLGWFHLGADLAPGASSGQTSAAGGDPSSASFLMVGTIEPRKGHAQALAAFELLWDRGMDARLVIIGKPGWRMDPLIRRLRQHPEAGKRLVWLERADDDELVAMYHGSAALLAASEGEGFGLPLIEAAQYGLPIIARDLPVFREVAGAHAVYFDGLAPEAIADAVTLWLQDAASGRVVSSTEMPWITWRQATAQLVDVVVGGGWSDAWRSDGRRCFLASDYRADATTGVLDRQRRLSTTSAGLLYGTPPFSATAGSYVVSVHGQYLGDDGKAWVDVVTTRGTWRVARADLGRGNAKLAELRVELREDASDVEVRVMVDGQVAIAFDRVDVVPRAD